MGFLGIAVIVIGLLVSSVGGILLLVAAFRKSIGWGLATLFLPLASVAFVIAHWPAAKRAFWTQFAGLLVMGCGFVLVIAAGRATAPETVTDETQPPSAGSFSMRQAFSRALQSPRGFRLPTAATAPTPVSTSNPYSCVGRPLSEVRAALGRPKGEMRHRGKVVLLYPDFSLLSENGTTVTALSLPKDTAALLNGTNAPPESTPADEAP